MLKNFNRFSFIGSRGAVELSLKCVGLDKSKLSSKDVEDYFIRMCHHFNPPMNKMVDINKYADKLVKYADCFFIQNHRKNVGFLAIYTNDYSGKMSFISSISIIPEYQGTGISQKLIGFSIEHARKKGMKYVKLEVNRSNARAIKFYERNGFNIESAGDNSLLMIKSI